MAYAQPGHFALGHLADHARSHRLHCTCKFHTHTRDEARRQLELALLPPHLIH